MLTSCRWDYFGPSGFLRRSYTQPKRRLPIDRLISLGISQNVVHRCRKERCRGLGVLSMFRDLQVEALGASLVDGYVAPMWRVTLMRVSAEGPLRYQGPASRTVAESHIPTSATKGGCPTGEPIALPGRPMNGRGIDRGYRASAARTGGRFRYAPASCDCGS